jgi:hypothetical protein
MIKTKIYSKGFYNLFKLLKFPRFGGSCPVNKLLSIITSVSVVICPSWGGNGPESRFPVTAKISSGIWDNVVGIVPLRKFSTRSISVRRVRFPNSGGIIPRKLKPLSCMFVTRQTELALKVQSQVMLLVGSLEVDSATKFHFLSKQEVLSMFTVWFWSFLKIVRNVWTVQNWSNNLSVEN